MCGIAGIWYLNQTIADPRKIRQMTNAMVHRGPDGEGFWNSDDYSLHLGHRRLAIIDLSENGKQPMIYKSRYVITLNGEIYNYIELKELLKKMGYDFVSQTDTEVLMAAYDYWGKECLTFLDGMFAFGIYDIAKEELFCARDRFGEKPFHYYIDEQRFMFASEMKTLWAGGADRSIDDYSIYLFLNLGLHEDPDDKTRTFFNNIKKLKPAHYLVYRKGQPIEQFQYWKISIALKKSDVSFEEACLKFREMFFTSVERRLRSDVPVGTSLSGGLDSSAIALTMHKILNGKTVQKCFSARFDDAKLDEGYFMAKVIENTSIEHFVNYPAANGLASSIEQIMYHQEEPFSGASIYAQWEVFKHAGQNGITVMLDGQGADEVLGGYTHFIEPFLRETYRRSGVKEMKRQYIYSIENNEITHPLSINIKFRLESMVPALWNFARTAKRKINGCTQSEFIHKDLYDLYKREKSPFIFYDTLDTSLRFYTFVSGLDRLLRFADRNSMAHSIEVRLPFLSHDLVEYVFSLPSDYIIHDGWTKALVRNGMSDILPKEIAWRKNKLGFMPPQKTWEQENSFYAMMKDFQQIAVEKKFIDPKSTICWEGFITGVFLKVFNL